MPRDSITFKIGCPFIIRIKYKVNDRYWSINKPLNIKEYTHNHPCNVDYNSITTKGKQKLITADDVTTITKMVQNKSSIPEIRKSISFYRGAPVLTYKDVAKFSKEIKESSVPNSKMKMRDTLLQNSDFYINTFSDYILYDDLKSGVCYAIEEEVGSKEIK
jgi:hypothetical protein